MKIRQTRIGTGLLAAGIAAGAAICWSAAPAAQAETTCNGKPITQVIEENADDQSHHGTAGDDVVLLKGSAWYVFDALAGDDTICAQGYGSEIIAGPGDDWVSASKVTEQVTLTGGAGDDTLTGSAGDDSIYGGPGRDLIKALGGTDGLYPDQTDFDHETVTEDAADTVDAGAGPDGFVVSILSAARTSGPDRLIGGDGEDSLVINGVRTELDTPQWTVRAAAGGPVDRFAGFEGYATWSSAVIRGSDRGEFIHAGGDDSRVDAGGGADEVRISGADATVEAGSGDDSVDYRADQAKGTVRLGRGNDELLLEAGRGVVVDGGPGDDRFRLLTHGEVEEEPVATGPMSATFRGQSGSDTLSWDCKATVDVVKDQLLCRHRKAKLTIGGMQAYQATEWGRWKATFRGGPHRDVFHGGANDDTMSGGKGKDTLIGGKGHDTADGGPGKDVCRAEVRKRC